MMPGEAPDKALPDVSRETTARLEHYAALLAHWNPRINLVSRSTLADVWTRHIADSAQLLELGGRSGHWVDLGSGGGLPGLVIAIVAAEKYPNSTITLVESDGRKCAFLRAAIRETRLSVRVVNARINDVDPLDADVLTARALADLPTLLGYCERHLARSGVALFPKGKTWKNELVLARKQWKFAADPIMSSTEPSAAILRIREVSRVRPIAS